MRIYKLHSHPEYGFYVGATPSGTQILVGYDVNALISVSFDADGSLLKVTEIPYEKKDQTDEKLEAWLEELDFVEGPISVREFFLEGRFIGIEDMPAEYADFLEDDSEFSAEDRMHIPKYIEDWKKRGDFVFWWNENYWCDREGFVHSS